MHSSNLKPIQNSIESVKTPYCFIYRALRFHKQTLESKEDIAKVRYLTLKPQFVFLTVGVVVVANKFRS